MRSKFESYMGFASRSGKLVAGTSACISKIERNQAKLLLIAADTAENTLEKLRYTAESKQIPVRIYGAADELSRIVGRPGRTAFAITDEHFAKMIAEQIDEGKKEVLG